MKRMVTATLVVAFLAVTALARAEDKPNPTGTWKWEVKFNDQTREMTLKLKLEDGKLTGAVAGRDGQETAIQDGKVEDGTVSFTVVRERNDRKMTRKYTGKISGDTIKGKSEAERDGQTQSRDWEAKRVVASAPTGTWKWSVTYGGQAHAMALTLKCEGDKLTGTVARDGQETAIQDAKCKDGDLSFTVVRERDGNKMTFQYNAKVSGNTIKGKTQIERNGQTQTYDWEAKKD
ncbi:MAG: hypothetical protein ACLQNE_41800 [Thermoguttaceae bacterium]